MLRKIKRLLVRLMIIRVLYSIFFNYSMSKPVSIGNFSWIGNRSTIGPGAKLPDYTIVASNSFVNKDFSSLIGGIPAKLIREGWTRVWDTKREFEYQKKEFPWYAYKYRSITL